MTWRALLVLAAIAVASPTRSLAGSKEAARQAREAGTLGPAGVGWNRLPGALLSRFLAPDVAVSVLDDGTMVEVTPGRVYVGSPTRGHRPFMPELVDGQRYLVREYTRGGAHRATYGITAGGARIAYNPATGVLARERRDGRWTIQRLDRGRFGAGTVIRKGAVDAALHGGAPRR